MLLGDFLDLLKSKKTITKILASNIRITFNMRLIIFIASFYHEIVIPRKRKQEFNIVIQKKNCNQTSKEETQENKNAKSMIKKDEQSTSKTTKTIEKLKQNHEFAICCFDTIEKNIK